MPSLPLDRDLPDHRGQQVRRGRQDHKALLARRDLLGYKDPPGHKATRERPAHKGPQARKVIPALPGQQDQRELKDHKALLE